MRRIISFMLIVALATQLPTASAAPTSASVQQEVNRLRTQAATKFEAANEIKIKVGMLQKETSILKVKELMARNERDEASNTLARMAIDQYKSDGFSQGFGLLFSRDPSKYLSDASILEMVGKKYSSSIRKFASAQQRLEASQLVVGDKTALLQAQQKRLNAEVLSARAALTRAEKILKSMKKEDRARLARAEKAREKKIFTSSKKYAKGYKGDNTRGSIALKYALQQIGDIYVWAAAGPTRWDCSGLTMRSFQQAGVSLPHSSRIQINYGKSVSYKSLKPGDLLFFGNPISHVSIYTGGGKMVQAPRPGKKVEVVPFALKFGYKPFVGARRL
ncbi:MAG: NlpC/P60 family protein [Candidatus Planktophila sp.]|nr:NlpC/P60 family protein [Candidatus Planktophila sp.]